MASLFSLFFYLTQFVQNILGFSPIKAGLSFLPLTLGIALVSGVVAKFVGRVGTRLPMTLGPLIAAVALIWISRISAHSTYTGAVLGPTILIAVALGLSFVPLTLTAISGVRNQEQGLASALLNTGQQVGASLGLAILVTVATAVTRGQHHAAKAVAVTNGYAAAFRVGAVLRSWHSQSRSCRSARVGPDSRSTCDSAQAELRGARGLTAGFGRRPFQLPDRSAASAGPGTGNAFTAARMRLLQARRRRRAPGASSSHTQSQ